MSNKVPVVLPRWGSIEAALILNWFKSVGEEVETDQPLLEVETEKSVVEVLAPATGIVSEILSHPDDEVLAGAVIGYIEVGHE